jgi:hypothetical protein
MQSDNINSDEATKLKPWQEKLLLEYIEETNESYQDFDLLQASNREPRVFGVSGTNLRRLFQYRHKYLKTLPITKYAQFLRKFKQNPSATTQRLVREATTNTASAAFEALSINETPDEVIIEPPPTDDEFSIIDTNDEEASQEGTVYSNMSEAPNWSSEFSSPMGRTPAPFGSPSMRTTLGPSPAPTVTTSSTPGRGSLFAPGGYTQYADNWVQPSQGTIEDPHRINVDPHRQENHREFDISYIPMKTVKGYARNVVHIRVDSVPGDHQLWEMTVPAGALRQLLIRGPSRSLHYSKEEKYHRKNRCDVTYGIHTKAAEDIIKSSTRRFSYWLIQFPPEITLDNGVFSDDQIEVSRNKVGLSYPPKETGIVGIGTNCMMVYWEIAEKKAGLRVATKEKEEDDAKCFN